MSFKSFVDRVTGNTFQSQRHLSEVEGQLQGNQPLETVYYKYQEKEKRSCIPSRIYFYGNRINALIGQKLLKSSTFDGKYLKERKKEVIELLKDNPEWVAQRFSVLVNGNKIDTFILGKREHLGNGTWLVLGNGSDKVWEKSVTHYQGLFKQMMDRLGINFLFFNYPGVGASEGGPSKCEILSTCRAQLDFVLDKKGGQAKKLVVWGASIGGGFFGSIMRTYQLPNDVQRVNVIAESFSSVLRVDPLFMKGMQRWKRALLRRLIPLAGRIFRWEIGPGEKEPIHPEIVIHQAKDNILYPKLGELVDDTTISVAASQARVTLKNNHQNAVVIGRRRSHLHHKYDDDVLDGIIQAIKNAWHRKFS